MSNSALRSPSRFTPGWSGESFWVLWIGLVLVSSFLLLVVRHRAAADAATMVPMADGVKLATTVSLPRGKPPFPTILIRTPYGKDALKGAVGNLAGAGYAVIMQDMRGRFASGGEAAIIFGNEGVGGKDLQGEKHRDGQDTLRWVAAQPWSNGRVATWGGSALGIVQNMQAPGAPDDLQGQVVIMAFSDYYHQAAYRGGVWRKELLENWLKATQMEKGNLATFLAHPTYDDFWTHLSSEAYADQVNAPGVFIGGWYDIFLQGTIHSFLSIQKRGGPNARGKCFLVIGPQAHGAFNQKIDYPNVLKSPINQMAPMNLFAHWLKDEKLPADLKSVQYYVMGAVGEDRAPGNLWRSADNWPPPAVATRYYFHPDHTLGDGKPVGGAQLPFRYDPQNPVPTMGGQNLTATKGPMDQRSIEERPDVLTFSTEPLHEPLEVTGPLSARLTVSSDCPDTDFTVKLSDVYPDGRSMLVTDGIQRASLHDNDTRRELLQPGKAYPLTVDLWSTSLIFNRGHRIRVAISSSNSPRFEPNPNTGDPHPVPGKSRIATNTVHLSAAAPSYILLPICHAN